jgi:hypothetical protein
MELIQIEAVADVSIEISIAQGVENLCSNRYVLKNLRFFEN